MPRNRYLATFAPGFEAVIGSLLSRELSGMEVCRTGSGMVLFDFEGTFSDAAAPTFFNNIFLVLREWKTSACSFSDMVKGSASTSRIAEAKVACRELGAPSFRVRYSRENVFASVDKKLMAEAERFVSAGTGLKSDRFDPGIEFWFIIRREDYACFALRLTKKQSTEKYLAPGELRPEIVQLVIALARVTEDDRVLLDPFAGHGAIPSELARLYPASSVFASDSDGALVAAMKERFSRGDGKSPQANVLVRSCDARKLAHISDGAVDVIVTDPPWGEWEGGAEASSIGALYGGILAEFHRVLAAGGRACILTGAKREFAEAVAASPSFAKCADREGFRTDILVNGKKCAVFFIAR